MKSITINISKTFTSKDGTSLTISKDFELTPYGEDELKDIQNWISGVEKYMPDSLESEMLDSQWFEQLLAEFSPSTIYEIGGYKRIIEDDCEE